MSQMQLVFHCNPQVILFSRTAYPSASSPYHSMGLTLPQLEDFCGPSPQVYQPWTEIVLFRVLSLLATQLCSACRFMEYKLGGVIKIAVKDIGQYQYLRCSTHYQPSTICQSNGDCPVSLAVQLFLTQLTFLSSSSDFLIF